MSLANPHLSSLISSHSGGNLNAASRQALMQKLARIEPAPVFTPTVYVKTLRFRVTTNIIILN